MSVSILFVLAASVHLGSLLETNIIHLNADILSALSECGHIVWQMWQVRNIKKNNRTLPIYFVDIEPNVNNKHIYNISSLLNTKVMIKKPNKTTYSPPQCFNSQDYCHTQKYCHHPPHCVK
jgi:hypothetical protein